MKPNFALSLSHQRISLQHRSAAGWRDVGEADPFSPELGDQLAALCRVAMTLAPGGLRSKLIIPNDQIRYLSIRTDGADAPERHRLAKDALDGATPYAVDELVFDLCWDGGQTHIAAVARETLEEAEKFATEHGFNPICFAARPESESRFDEEPFFGPTRSAKALLAPGEDVERETPLAPDHSEGKDGPVLSDEERASQNGPELQEQPSFVSRRRVPTFRTNPLQNEASHGTDSEPGGVSGFAEPAIRFRMDSGIETAPDKKVHVVPAPAPIVRRTNSEVERFTIYGAPTEKRTARPAGSKALVLLSAIVVVSGLAAFASGMRGSDFANLYTRYFDKTPDAQFTALPEPEAKMEVATPAVADPDKTNQVELASLQPSLSDEDAAVLDALRDDETPAKELDGPTLQERLQEYAATGIWPDPPDVPKEPPLVEINDLYVTSIDPINQNFDAVALPQVSGLHFEHGFFEPLPPAPAGTRFVLDERGMVVPSTDGSLNPDGVMVYAGRPAAAPPERLVKLQAPGEDLELRLRISGYRPKSRPDNLIETSERAAYSGLTRSELSELRPELRPQSEQENALAAASLAGLNEGNGRALLEQPEDRAFVSATTRAVAASLRPDARPRGFENIVAKALEAAPRQQTAAASAVTRSVAPTIPSSASVTREATVKNAINLRNVNLIGVYGTPSNRRALVRLENGSYKKLEVGDQLDGGRVSAIGDKELRYQRGGRSIVLKMPRG